MTRCCLYNLFLSSNETPPALPRLSAKNFKDLRSWRSWESMLAALPWENSSPPAPLDSLATNFYIWTLCLEIKRAIIKKFPLLESKVKYNIFVTYFILAPEVPFFNGRALLLNESRRSTILFFALSFFQVFLWSVSLKCFFQVFLSTSLQQLLGPIIDSFHSPPIFAEIYFYNLHEFQF